MINPKVEQSIIEFLKKDGLSQDTINQLIQYLNDISEGEINEVDFNKIENILKDIDIKS